MNGSCCFHNAFTVVQILVRRFHHNQYFQAKVTEEDMRGKSPHGTRELDWFERVSSSRV
jgi:hypothetical protein